MPRHPPTPPLFPLSPLIPLFLLFACASSPKDAREPAPPRVEEPPPPVEALPPASQPSIVVGSIRLVGDCPPSSPEDELVCMGASLNLRIHNNADRAQRIAIRSVKLVRPDHEAVLAELRTATPQRWEEDGYRPWDELSRPGQEESILYDELTAPLLAYYDARGLLHRVDGNPVVDTVTNAIIDAISREVTR